MRRIRDELALRARRLLESREHRVEARRKPAQLVLSVDVDSLGEILRLGDTLDRRRQPLDGRERGSRDEQSQYRRDHDPAERDDDEEEPDAIERLLDLCERACDLHGCARAIGEREDTHVRAVDRHVVPERRTLLACDGENVVVDRKLDVLPRRHEHGAVRLHELDVAPRLAELRAQRQIALSALPGYHAQRLRRDLCSARLERLVDRRAQLLARDEVDEHGRGDDRHRDGCCRAHSDACPEAHAQPSRSAYPTPRTVWISRERPPSSVLRRRYPM